MNILVTGATGLVGSHLLYELALMGNRISATKRHSSSTEFVKWVWGLYCNNVDELFALIDWIDIDMLDYQQLLEATRGIDRVYHTAAMVSFNPADKEIIIDTNVSGTANLIDACIENGVTEFCHVSSIASLGEANSNGIIDEQCKWTELKGQSTYARSKFMGENQVWRGYENGLRVVVVNPSVILGPGRWDSGSGQLFSQIKKCMPFYTLGVGGYVDVRDVARAMVQLMDNSSINGERFVLNSQNLSFKQLFSDMAIGFGKKPPRINIKPWLVYVAYPFIFIAGLLTGKGNAISLANLKSAFTKTYYSSQKITDRIGFEFIPIADSIKFITSCFQGN